MINTKEKNDLRKKQNSDLIKCLGQARKDLFNLRFKQVNGNLNATHHLRINRRKVAFIKTILTERQQLDVNESVLDSPQVTKKREA